MQVANGDTDLYLHVPVMCRSTLSLHYVITIHQRQRQTAVTDRHTDGLTDVMLVSRLKRRTLTV